MSSFKYPVDDSELAQMDPLVQAGYSLLFQDELQVEIRSNGQSSLEQVQVQVFYQPDSLKVELHSITDLFFSYCYDLSPSDYSTLQAQHGLKPDYHSFGQTLVKWFMTCKQQPMRLFCLAETRPHRLDLTIVENVSFRFVEFLKLCMVQNGDDRVRQAITFKYNCMKVKMQQAHHQLGVYQHTLKLKSPSLLSQINASFTTNNRISLDTFCLKLTNRRPQEQIHTIKKALYKSM